MTTRACWSCLVSLATIVPLEALAQPVPPPVTQHTERAAEAAAEVEETTEWTAALGAILTTGNTRNFSLSAGSRLALKRGQNAFAAEFQMVYGRAALRDETTGDFGDWELTAQNINAKARYDRFFTLMDAIFAAAVYRRDTFAGLDVRLQGQLGYLRNIYKGENHRLWGEVGYDITFDNFDPDPLLDADGNELDGEEVLHSARAFIGYDNHLNEAVTLLTGLEALFDVQEADNVRLAWVTELRSKVADSLQVGLNFTLRYDNVPVEGAEKLDTLTTLNLLYTLL